MDVFFTVDVEIWCDGWSGLDSRFPVAFEQYVHGRTRHGDAGLGYQTSVLRDAGLRGVFFVEPLFSMRFGQGPLQQIVELLQGADQEVQLHLHPEWIDEVSPSLVPLPERGPRKRPLLRQYPATDQAVMIQRGIELLAAAGAPSVNAFRAGSFGFNADTLLALEQCGICIDSSYNATLHGPESGVEPGRMPTDVFRSGGMIELPMTVFDDGFGRLRHVQLGACSWAELEGLLWQAAEQGRHTFVILSHNFELLSPSKARIDPVVRSRFLSLTRFLDRHRDVFQTRGLSDWTPPAAIRPGSLLRSRRLRTGWRTLEQAWRRRYR